MSKTAAKNIRLLLIDDHALFRESVARLLQAEPGFEVVADCSSGTEAMRIIKSREIDIVLLDLDLGQERGADFLERLRAERFKGKVLLVTAGVNESDVPSSDSEGNLRDLLETRLSIAELIQGIREAMEGKALFRSGFAAEGVRKRGANSARSRLRARLTERERRVLSFIFEGLANKQIGDRLQISESAVKACLQQLFAKTGVRTRSQLVRIALEQYRDQL